MGKCRVENDEIVEMCNHLSERLEYANARRKGLVPMVLTHNVTNREKLYVIRYNESASDKNPLALNYCPWCGTYLTEFLHKKKNTAKSDNT